MGGGMIKLAYRIKHGVERYLLLKKGVSIRKDSYIKRPYFIEGGKYIQIGNNVSISPYSKISCFDYYSGNRYCPSIKIGDGVFINRFVTILSADELEIGSYTFIGSYVSITNENHGTIPCDVCYGSQSLLSAPVSIGRNCWIGDHVTILPGTTIGEYSIIGAGSVVSKSIPAFSIAVGIPAKIVKQWDPVLLEWSKV